MSDKHREVLESHKDTADLVINHGYLPNGSNGVVYALNEVYKEKTGIKIDTHCPSCITNAFKYLYNSYLPSLQEPPKEKKKKK